MWCVVTGNRSGTPRSSAVRKRCFELRAGMAAYTSAGAGPQPDLLSTL
jgi:hypothetical protein